LDLGCVARPFICARLGAHWNYPTFICCVRALLDVARSIKKRFFMALLGPSLSVYLGMEPEHHVVGVLCLGCWSRVHAYFEHPFHVSTVLDFAKNTKE